MKPGMVLIRYRDHSDWDETRIVKELRKDNPDTLMESVGFLVSEDDLYVTISADWYLKGFDEERVGRTRIILKEAILERKEI